MQKKRDPVNYKVSGRVAIAMDALDDKQKKVVEGAISNKTRFITYSKKPGRVKNISANPPLYVLMLDSGMRVVYSQSEDAIEIVDLMQKNSIDVDAFNVVTSNSKVDRSHARSE